MTPIKKAERLAMGETLTRNEIRGDEKQIIQALKEIKQNCNVVIKQLKEVSNDEPSE